MKNGLSWVPLSDGNGEVALGALGPISPAFCCAAVTTAAPAAATTTGTAIIPAPWTGAERASGTSRRDQVLLAVYAAPATADLPPHLMAVQERSRAQSPANPFVVVSQTHPTAGTHQMPAGGRTIRHPPGFEARTTFAGAPSTLGLSLRLSMLGQLDWLDRLGFWKQVQLRGLGYVLSSVTYS